MNPGHLSFVIHSQVFSNTPPGTVLDKFPEACPFSLAASKLLVTEVRRRASEQSTEEAADTITAYLVVSYFNLFFL